MSDEQTGCPHDHVDGWYVGIEGCRGCGKVVDWHDGETAPVFRDLDALRERVATLEDGIEAHKSYIDARSWEYPAMKKLRPIPLQADLDLHALLDPEGTP